MCPVVWVFGKEGGVASIIYETLGEGEATPLRPQDV